MISIRLGFRKENQRALTDVHLTDCLKWSCPPWLLPQTVSISSQNITLLKDSHSYCVDGQAESHHGPCQIGRLFHRLVLEANPERPACMLKRLSGAHWVLCLLLCSPTTICYFQCVCICPQLFLQARCTQDYFRDKTVGSEAESGLSPQSRMSYSESGRARFRY
ncbi:hypothetical protein AUEXF2481DRAFT_151723 [Aureobasidium subglaciale EXF-2481]|uniref:Uncharacterized protein n=1 Tax=Aureobasidium subglaciale (strain EXF-2481) TaxID=1043005 RepID=A0A074YSG0_AURSE|nr:uncharacterized protein AUEXF2481DRAFT_151723 [Aureobasidium subglaciale EXF-2481]KER00674.1 hypothetical protein AUEXF2481DRAFT_151723 [Aureobasidium subglaciale EXF-2481]